MRTPILECRQISYRHDNSSDMQLHKIDLIIFENDFVSIVWPSWIGKSTLLDLIAGIKEPNQWEILFQNNIIHKTPQHLDLHSRKNVGIIFQNYGLFPRLNVQQHIEFWLNDTSKDKDTKEETIWDILLNIWLENYRKYYPHELSWWMQQRLAVWSIIANDSPCLLMDEPFSAVDIVLRKQMQDFITHIYRVYNKTIIFVTHQIEEAILLSNKIIVLWGKPTTIIETIDLPKWETRDLYDQRYINLQKHIVNLIMQNQ